MTNDNLSGKGTVFHEGLFVSISAQERNRWPSVLPGPGIMKCSSRYAKVVPIAYRAAHHSRLTAVLEAYFGDNGRSSYKGGPWPYGNKPSEVARYCQRFRNLEAVLFLKCADWGFELPFLVGSLFSAATPVSKELERWAQTSWGEVSARRVNVPVCDSAPRTSWCGRLC